MYNNFGEKEKENKGKGAKEKEGKKNGTDKTFVWLGWKEKENEER